MSNKKDSKDLSNIISKFKDLSKEEKIELVSYLINELKKLHEVGEQEIFGKKEMYIPVGIFANDVLGSLEAIVKYLKEGLKLRFSKIAVLLNRNNKTIWATYHKASKKMPLPFGDISRDIIIPVLTFANRSFSTLENVVAYLKDLDYSNHEVALMLHLDDRTIWTIFDKVKKKRGMKIE